MNKESIYKIIGYHGEYTENVKKALRKLLKENHPDHKGDKEAFKLINEVKKELEENKVSYKYKEIGNNKKFDDIDYDFCSSMINSLIKKKNELEKNIKSKNSEKKSLDNDYKKLYNESLENENFLLSNKNILKLNSLKITCIIMLFILIITFLLYVFKNNNIWLILFSVCALILILIVYNFFVSFREISKINESNVKKYIRLMKHIETINEKNSVIAKEIIDMERRRIQIENDLRFYNNLFK